MLNFHHLFLSHDMAMAMAMAVTLAGTGSNFGSFTCHSCKSSSCIQHICCIYIVRCFGICSTRLHFIRCVRFNLSFWAASSPFSFSYYMHTIHFQCANKLWFVLLHFFPVIYLSIAIAIAIALLCSHPHQLNTHSHLEAGMRWAV